LLGPFRWQAAAKVPHARAHLSKRVALGPQDGLPRQPALPSGAKCDPRVRSATGSGGRWPVTTDQWAGRGIAL
jgi:hypothetical protein